MARYSAQHHIPDILEDAENGLPMLARRLLHDTYLRLQVLNEQVLAYDRELNPLARDRNRRNAYTRSTPLSHCPRNR